MLTLKKICVCGKVSMIFFPLDPSGMQMRLFADLSISMFGFSTSVPKKDLCIKIDLALSTEHAFPAHLNLLLFDLGTLRNLGGWGKK